MEITDALVKFWVSYDYGTLLGKILGIETPRNTNIAAYDYQYYALLDTFIHHMGR